MSPLEDYQFSQRIDPEVVRIRKRRHRFRRDITCWFQSVEIEMRRLLAHRGGRDQAIEVYLRLPRLIHRSNSAAIGADIELTFSERVELGITSMRPSDVPWRVCRRRYKLARNVRKRERAASRRRQEGRIPWSLSFARTKPWEAEGISRSTWYKRRQKSSSDESVPPPSGTEGAMAQSRPSPSKDGLPMGARPVSEPIGDSFFASTESVYIESNISTLEREGTAVISGLRPYQEQALADIRASVKGGVRRIVVQAPTGAGKTRLAAAIMQGATSKGNPAAFVVPSLSLIDQTIERFWAEGIRDVGVIQANHVMTDWSRPIQVCSIQTIRRRGYPRASVVMFDEVHQFHDAHKDWVQHPDWQNVPIIGLSATPWTAGLGKYFDTLLVVETMQELINQNYLSKFRVFGAGHPDLSDVKIVAGDYHEGQLSGAMQQGSLTADIVRTYQEMWGKGQTLCFCVDRAHAQSVRDRFEYAGIRCGYQDANTPPEERADIMRKFHSGEYQVVTNIQTLTTGVDWDVRCLILARPTRSEMLYVQIVGRALRTHEGKDCAIILDHSDTTQRLGFVTDIHHDHLSMGKEPPKQEKRKPLPKECPKCTALRPAGKSTCPNCGFEAKPVSHIAEGDGLLVELERHKKTKAKKRQSTMAEKQQFFAELKKWCAIKGYSEGWASHKYQTRFGVWPDHSFKHISPATKVSPEVYTWIRGQNIRWAKSKQNTIHRTV